MAQTFAPVAESIEEITPDERSLVLAWAAAMGDVAAFRERGLDELACAAHAYATTLDRLLLERMGEVLTP